MVAGCGVLAAAGGGWSSFGGGACRRSAADGRGARSLGTSARKQGGGTTLEQRELVDGALPLGREHVRRQRAAQELEEFGVLTEACATEAGLGAWIGTGRWRRIGRWLDWI